MYSSTNNGIFSYDLKELPELIEQIYPHLKPKQVLALHGELGAGKTTFTRQLCQFLNVQEPPDSPTFSIINEYSFRDDKGTENIIYHTDWYRLKDEEEAVAAGVDDILSQDYFWCIIEWPENAPDLLPEQTVHLYFSMGDTLTKRRLVIEDEHRQPG